MICINLDRRRDVHNVICQHGLELWFQAEHISHAAQIVMLWISVHLPCAGHRSCVVSDDDDTTATRHCLGRCDVSCAHHDLTDSMQVQALRHGDRVALLPHCVVKVHTCCDIGNDSTPHLCCRLFVGQLVIRERSAASVKILVNGHVPVHDDVHRLLHGLSLILSSRRHR